MGLQYRKNRENRLRVLRAERRLPEHKLAVLAGLEVTRMWRIENGYIDPTRQERQALAKALNKLQREIWPEATTTAA